MTSNSEMTVQDLKHLFCEEMKNKANMVFNADNISIQIKKDKDSSPEDFTSMIITITK